MYAILLHANEKVINLIKVYIIKFVKLNRPIMGYNDKS